MRIFHYQCESLRSTLCPSHSLCFSRCFNCSDDFVQFHFPACSSAINIVFGYFFVFVVCLFVLFLNRLFQLNTDMLLVSLHCCHLKFWKVIHSIVYFANYFIFSFDWKFFTNFKQIEANDGLISGMENEKFQHLKWGKRKNDPSRENVCARVYTCVYINL